MDNKLYAIIRYEFQNRLGLENPKVIHLFKSKEKATESADKIHTDIWSELFKNGVSNDSFEYYNDFIIENGFDINSGSIENSSRFVQFLKTAKMFNEYTQEYHPLNGLKIIQLIELVDKYFLENKERFLIIERLIRTDSDMFYTLNDEYIGMPHETFSNKENADKKRKELTLSKIKDELLRGDIFSNLRECWYWSEDYCISDEVIEKVRNQLDAIGYKGNVENLADFEKIHDIIIGITGVGFLDYYSVQQIEIED